MGKRKFLWAFLLPASAIALHALHAPDAIARPLAPIRIAHFLFASLAQAADPPPNITSSSSATYVPPSASSSPSVQKALSNASASQPGAAATPGAPGAGGVPTIAVPTPDNFPAPSQTQGTSFGQYRNKNGEVNITKLFLDRYKQSVVRVTARDRAGNILARAMGVGVGPTAQYIATPLSIVLGNSQEWADEIEISHQSGNEYSAKVALIDEEKNIVLLAPETNPAPLPFVREKDERQNVTVYTIAFEDLPDNAGIEARIHSSMLAAVNRDTGILSVASLTGKPTLTDAEAGTGIINTQGELVGMLLPGNKGVLASTINKLVARAQKSQPMDPSMIGVILGRGVVVSPNKQEGAFTTISAALEAIKKGEAPKPDLKRYTPAKNLQFAPKKNDKVVIKVMPGTYKEGKVLSVPPNVSIAGAGSDQTVIAGSDPEKPVILVQNAENVMISNLRVVPAPLQQLKAPTVIFSKTKDITLLGNVVEAKGGVGIWVNESQRVNILGNAFPRGQSRAISCDKSDLEVRTNAFLGDWSYAVAVDKNCNATIANNLFFENKTAVSVFHPQSRTKVEFNTFIRATNAIRATGDRPVLSINDNLFFETTFAIYSEGDLNSKLVGRSAAWKTKFQARGRNITTFDIIRTEPEFVNPGFYDFRIKPGKGQLGVAALEKGKDLGAFQTQDFMGAATQQLAKSLSTAVNDPKLVEEWGME